MMTTMALMMRRCSCHARSLPHIRPYQSQGPYQARTSPRTTTVSCPPSSLGQGEDGLVPIITIFGWPQIGLPNLRGLRYLSKAIKVALSVALAVHAWGVMRPGRPIGRAK